ncbi:MAG: hypothetical protein D6736_10490, partial [Nitrospinota bacterium]
APAVGGETYPADTAARSSAGGGCARGRRRGSGNGSGAPCWLPWKRRGNGSGLKRSGMGPAFRPKRGRSRGCDQAREREQSAVGDRWPRPNLLRAPKAMPYTEVLDSLQRVRQEFTRKQIHVFGIGGTATLHLATLLGMDSVDSSGWRNRAARGLVQLSGRGDRLVANLGSWCGRELNTDEWEILAACPCPACKQFGVAGLKKHGIQGFCNRATHNLWTLLEEARQIKEHLSLGNYESWYEQHVDNSIYRPLIDYVLQWQRR